MNRKLAIVLALGVIPLAALAAELNVFQSGDPISANEINQNFSELESRISSTGSAQKLTVFSSSSTFTGGQGRVAMNAACVADNSAASLCSLERLQRASAETGINYGTLSANSWVDTLEPHYNYNGGYFETDNGNSVISNCQGWSSSGTINGRVLRQSGKIDYEQCGNTYSALCCM